ncbi:MAG: TraM recognition domain-containing protein [Lacipirellulaceae bacterium]
MIVSIGRVLELYGFRVALAVAAAPLAALATAAVGGSGPPSDWSGLSPAAQLGTGRLIGAGIVLATAAWLRVVAAAFSAPSTPAWWLPTALRMVTTGLMLGGSLGVAFAVASLLFEAPERAPRAITIATEVLGVPVVVGAAIAKAPWVLARFAASPALRRWLLRGHNAATAGPIGLGRQRATTRRATTRGPSLSRQVLLGETLFEDTYRPHLVGAGGNGHVGFFGGPGGGKNLLGGVTYGTHEGSMVAISTKPEIADAFAGFYADPSRRGPAGATPTTDSSGLDPRPLTQIEVHKPNSVAHVVDPGGETVYPSSRHVLHDDVDPSKPNAVVAAEGIFAGCFAPDPNNRDPAWYREMSIGWTTANLLYDKAIGTNPLHCCLPLVVERSLGVDSIRGKAGAQVLNARLRAMRKCNHPVVGPYVQSIASQVDGLGENGLGAVLSEVGVRCRFLLSGWMRDHLIGASDFSYADVGDDNRPMGVFIVPLRGQAGIDNSIPWLRMHTGLAVAHLTTRKQRPEVSTLLVADEARQWLSGVRAVSGGLTLLRESHTRCLLHFQSWSSALATLGKDVAGELEATSTLVYFALSDLETAERLSRRLGYVHLPGIGRVPLKPASELLKELSIDSPLAYAVGAGMPACRFRRLSFRTVSTRDGLRLRGLPALQGQYDDLSRYRYGGRP